MEYGIIGTSIWQQNMPLLERLTIDRDRKPEILAELKTRLDLDELIYVATCNRVEFVYVTSGKHRGSRLLHRLIDFFICSGDKIAFFPNDFFHHHGKDAITHLFRTTASLESLVMGENQITGQFKLAAHEAAEAGLAGPILNRLAGEALAVAKKVKRDTLLGVGSVSMASLAITELRKLLQSKKHPVIALVGSGAMQAKLAKYVKDSFAGELLFVNRTVSRVEELAEDFGGRCVALADFRQNPGQVDAIISATAAPEAIFDVSFLDRLLAAGEPVVCIDLAIPRDFSLDFAGDERAILIDIPLLKSKGQVNLRQKFIEAGKANEIVRDAVNKYLANRIEISLKPIFQDSFQDSIQQAQQALDDLFSRHVTSLRQDEQEAVRRLVTKLIGQSSFGPVRLLSGRLANRRAGLNLNDISVVRREAI